MNRREMRCARCGLVEVVVGEAREAREMCRACRQVSWRLGAAVRALTAGRVDALARPELDVAVRRLQGIR